MRKLANFKINSLAWTIIALVVVSGVLYIFASVLIADQIAGSNQIWQTYSVAKDRKAAGLASIKEHLGYGGLIHHYKNYILRQDQSQLDELKTDRNRLTLAIAKYRAAGANEEEVSRLDSVLETAQNYVQSATSAQPLIEQKTPARNIDRQLSVDDDAVLKALAFLEQLAAEKNGDAVGETKVSLLREARAALGYGGMIQHFKNYILQQDPDQLERLRADLARAHSALEAYGDFAMAPTEQEALPRLMKALEAYEKAGNKAAELVAAGTAPEEIDAATSIDSNPILEDFAILEKAIQNEVAGADEAMATSLATAANLTQGIKIYAGATGVLLALMVYFILFQLIIKPVEGMSDALTALAKGDTTTDVSKYTSDNEIGDMARAAEVLKQEAKRKRELEQEQAEQKQRAEAERRETMNRLADSFTAKVGAIVEALASASGELNATAQSMSDISSETSERASNVASTSEQSSGNLQTVAAATEQMAATVKSIAQDVFRASEASSTAVRSASATSTQIEGLAEAADKIGEVVRLISDIAEQTNLLALNATIESARAGEAGKGFAVVAGEVKALANETAKATDNINEQIAAIQNATKQAVVSMTEISEVVKQLDETAATIATAMEQQGKTTQEISQNIQDVANGTRDVSDNIGRVSEVAQESGNTSQQVTSAANALAGHSERLRTEIKNFIDEIRAA